MGLAAKRIRRYVRSDLKALRKPVLQVAPIAANKLPATVPATWKPLLTASDPRRALVDYWKPVAKLLPRTTRMIGRKLADLALLTANGQPPTLVYLFSTQFGTEVMDWHGTPPAAVEHPHLAHVSNEFLAFYAIHGGWTVYKVNSWGPKRPGSWKVVSDRLIAVADNCSGSVLAFDLESRAPRAVVVNAFGKTKPVDPWPTLDGWIAKISPQLDEP